jgi:uncharacterized membrane protein
LAFSLSSLVLFARLICICDGRCPGRVPRIYKIRIGRSLLLGLEVLVAADIVKTIAHELSFISLGLLAGLVLVRTFLSWTLVLEIDGRWPWQREPSPMSSRARPRGLVEAH